MEWLVGAAAVGCWLLLLLPAVVAPLLDAEALDPAPGPAPLPLAALPEPVDPPTPADRVAA